MSAGVRSYLTALCTLIGVSCTIHSLLSLLSSYNRAWWGREGRGGRVCEVLLFPDEGSSLDRLERLLTSARDSLEVCQYVFSCRRLAGAVLELHRRGVFVRVLVDAAMSGCAGSQTGRLSSAGVPTRLARMVSPAALMHHKFAVIDGKTVISGSFNWTRQASAGNHENVIVTDEQSIVRRFVCQFEELWQMYTA